MDAPKVVMITGVSSGFGRAMAVKLASQGHKVYGTVRREVEALPGVTYVQAEVQDEASVAAAVNAVVAAEGRIDVFINNAGMGIGGPIEFTPLEDASRQMDINFMGMVRFLHYVVPQMRRQGGGRILCFSSIGGLMGLPFQGFYSASKFAIEGYCEALRLELRGKNIDVVLIEPGDFATGFTASRKSTLEPEAYTAYPTYAESLKSIEHDEQSGLKPEFLAEKVARIVACKHPAYHYIISTLEQRLSVTLKALLPQSWFAAILASYYKLK